MGRSNLFKRQQSEKFKVLTPHDTSTFQFSRWCQVPTTIRTDSHANVSESSDQTNLFFSLSRSYLLSTISRRLLMTRVLLPALCGQPNFPWAYENDHVGEGITCLGSPHSQRRPGKVTLAVHCWLHQFLVPFNSINEHNGLIAYRRLPVHAKLSSPLSTHSRTLSKYL